ncbi:suppressor of fused domain protein [Aeromicrobium sp. Leaf350]|uniref:suppressor of fused domain protein n=1 Tax=Aeromicrobium sp. Leaf350 TaxID=2876565 RepID=UPI001E5D8D31|nr:suppressor of fused domain protein [Aeromicrobium sp. Leaf350]
MIDSYEVVHRVSGALGLASVPPPMTRSDGERKIGMVEVPDSPTRGVTTWATVAASFFPTGYRTPDGRPIGVEMVAGIDSRWSFVGDAVAACAFQIGEPNEVRPGTIYRGAIGDRFTEASTPHLMSVPPFLWGSFESFSDPDIHVTWLQLVPVTDAEADYCLKHGFDAIGDAFDRGQPDLFSIERRSVSLDGA